MASANGDGLDRRKTRDVCERGGERGEAKGGMGEEDKEGRWRKWGGQVSEGEEPLYYATIDCRHFCPRSLWVATLVKFHPSSFLPIPYSSSSFFFSFPLFHFHFLKFSFSSFFLFHFPFSFPPFLFPTSPLSSSSTFSPLLLFPLLSHSDPANKSGKHGNNWLAEEAYPGVLQYSWERGQGYWRRLGEAQKEGN